ncbi:MAG: Translation factor SUA5 [Candidatus Yanofskybacteria bacterium GW2011_GWD2_39_48]|uniref:L-threonylcarbamoyladenylate synthase n=1 Tax=Candidatus Yanofskybacteria bacterium GW2011_GWD2_39_48 TaxID=1619031 RepID=A0A0G0RMD3_9BACT|nr:MAG: Translation factor SUA5 [Candidatus Yanofskybacteria bacterium GW2011_GWD2_39_48]
MEIITVDSASDYREVIELAVGVLGRGGVIVYPTDTLYGLGANAMNYDAVRRIFDIKERDLSKPLPILIKNMIWAKGLAYISPRQEKILEKIWPGKVTAILEKKDVVLDIVSAKTKTIGVRIAEHPFTDKLLGRFGYPIISTSANISGDEPTLKIDDIIQIFSEKRFKPDLIIDAGTLPKSDASIVIDMTTEKPKILRVGLSRPDELLKILEI